MTDRNELERLLAAATPGPWRCGSFGNGEHVPGLEHIFMDAAEISIQNVLSEDAALICFLRNSAQHYLSLMDEVYRWKQNALAYIATAAVQYAKERGLPDGHLHPHHYDLMEQAGGYMDSFTRAEIGETHDN